MGSLYGSGLRAALRCWRVALVLFLLSAGFGITFGGAAWCWLAQALDSSLATRTLLWNLDPEVFVDLLVHHADSLQMLVLVAVLLLGVWVFVGVWTSALAVVAVGERAAWSADARRAFDLYPTFLRLWAIAWLAAGVVLCGLALPAQFLVRWANDLPSEFAAYSIAFATLGAAGLALLVLTTVHDHARIHAAATDAGALAAYAWAVTFVGVRSRLALPLAALLFVTSGLLWATYQGLGALVRTDWVPGLVLSLIWAQAWILARSFMRLWFFAAETELQNASDVAP